MNNSELIMPGEDVFVLSISPVNDEYGVVFYGDKEFGEFCACGFESGTKETNGIFDILLIYIVKEFLYRGMENEIEFRWSGSGEQVLVKLNKKPVAVYDFESKQGYNRTGLPGQRELAKPFENYAWDEGMLAYF